MPDVIGQLSERRTCRICDSPALAPVLDLGPQFISGAFPKIGQPPPVLHRLPLELVRCDVSRDPSACGLVQLRHSVPGDLLYRSYWYRSGINRTMTENLHEIAEQAVTLARPQAHDLVLDIGCNDGTLLDGYQDDSLMYLGVDPSDVTRYAVAKGYDVVNDFFSYDVVRRRYPGRRARIITSIAMFYDLEDPGAFVADIARSLDHGGVWVIELAYLPTMLAATAFDTICHEHLEYYTFAVLERLLHDAGLETVKVDLNNVNGGSIRLFAAHIGTVVSRKTDASAINELREKELSLQLNSSEPYEQFKKRTEAVRAELRALVHELVSRGNTVHVYGASTKGNTILQYCDIDATLIPYAADRNPDKWGCETIASRIPIISEEESRAKKPDYYLALPWHFFPEFIDREHDFLGRGGQFIVPLPEVRVVGMQERAALDASTAVPAKQS